MERIEVTITLPAPLVRWMEAVCLATGMHPSDVTADALHLFLRMAEAGAEVEGDHTYPRGIPEAFEYVHGTGKAFGELSEAEILEMGSTFYARAEYLAHFAEMLGEVAGVPSDAGQPSVNLTEGPLPPPPGGFVH